MRLYDETGGWNKQCWTQEFKDKVYACVKTIAKEGDIKGGYIDLEQSCRLIRAWQEMHPPSIEECMRHRCSKHLDVGQLNSSVVGGAECGACVLDTARALLSEQARSLYKVEEEQHAQAAQMPKMPTHSMLVPGQRQMLEDLIIRWHQRFQHVVVVGDELGFPVMGEVFHRTRRTEPYWTFNDAFKRLEWLLLSEESIEGGTLYVRVTPNIEHVYDFDQQQHIWRGVARFSFTETKKRPVA